MRLGINVPNLGPTTNHQSLRGWDRLAEKAGDNIAMW
jgi:hypothetical protein